MAKKLSTEESNVRNKIYNIGDMVLVNINQSEGLYQYLSSIISDYTSEHKNIRILTVEDDKVIVSDFQRQRILGEIQEEWKCNSELFYLVKVFFIDTKGNVDNHKALVSSTHILKTKAQMKDVEVLKGFLGL